MFKKSALALLAGAALFTASAHADQLATKKTLTLDIAKKLAAVSNHASDSVISKETTKPVRFFIVIMDEGGNIMYIEREDGAQLGSLEVATQKARSCVYFRRPTKAFEDAVNKGLYPSAVKVPNAMPVEGGFPLFVDGQLVGAIGVSGGSPAEDAQVASAAVAALPSIIK